MCLNNVQLRSTLIMDQCQVCRVFEAYKVFFARQPHKSQIDIIEELKKHNVDYLLEPIFFKKNEYYIPTDLHLWYTRTFNNPIRSTTSCWYDSGYHAYTKLEDAKKCYDAVKFRYETTIFNDDIKIELWKVYLQEIIAFGDNEVDTWAYENKQYGPCIVAAKMRLVHKVEL